MCRMKIPLKAEGVGDIGGGGGVLRNGLSWFYWWLLLRWGPFLLVQVRPPSWLPSHRSCDPKHKRVTFLPLPPAFFFFLLRAGNRHAIQINARPYWQKKKKKINRFFFCLAASSKLLQHITLHVHTRTCEWEGANNVALEQKLPRVFELLH